MFLYINFLDLTKVASCIGKYKYTFVEVLNNLSNGVSENGKISLIYLLSQCGSRFHQKLTYTKQFSLQKKLCLANRATVYSP